MGQHIGFASFGGRCTGYLATPETGSGNGSGVVVIQEWWGLVPHIENLVDRFAAAGFVALAPDHYRGAHTTEPDEAAKMMMGLQIDKVAEDIAGAAEYLLTRDDVTGRGVGAVGFCMGGGLALLAPTVYSHITATVAFYPAMPWPAYHPDWSRYAGKAALVHKAATDEEAWGAAIAELGDRIGAAGGSCTVHDDYPDSVHAFFNDDRPEVYQADNAARAWDRTIAFLRERLSG